MTNPLLALTMGEPGGVAPEITIAAWQHFRTKDVLSFFVIADKELLQTAGPDIAIKIIDSPSQAADVFKTALPVIHQPLNSPAVAGVADRANAIAVIASIDRAVEFCFEKLVGGVVTNPIQKESLYDTGFSFQGHTDYLAHLSKAAGHEVNPVMMLSAKDLRTVPISVHIAIKDVPSALSKELIIEQTLTAAKGLSRWFNLSQPRIAITGLNPHAGENGSMGREEIEFISPAIAELIGMGLDVTGPLPADTVFHEEARANYDIIMCMYHDQALIPVKTLGFHDGVNTTLGLPFIRTSPDHGTALTLAGKGLANPSSLIAALQQAAYMVNNSQNQS